jgi:hypothetical protein
MKLADRVCAIVFFCIGVFFFVNIPIYIDSRKNDVLGSRFFPYTIAVTTIALSILLFIITFISDKYTNKTIILFSIKNETRVFLFIATVASCLIIVQHIGFLPGVITMITITLLILSVRRIGWYFIVYFFVAGMYLFFRYILRIFLP